MNQIIEWAEFELKENITEENLLKVSQTLQTEFLDKQAGFMKRELLHKGGKKWVDLVHWESLEKANLAMENAIKSETCMNYFHLMLPLDQSISIWFVTCWTSSSNFRIFISLFC